MEKKRNVNRKPKEVEDEVINYFLHNNDNRLIEVSKATGVKLTTVSSILDRYFKQQKKKI